MADLFDFTRNFSLYTIPAAWLLSIAPHFYAITLAGDKFDNRSPRSLNKTLESDQTLDKRTRTLMPFAETKTAIQRAEAAQMNGFENIGLFAAAVAAGNAAGLDNQTLNLYSGGYLALRALYNLVYINNDSVALSNVRSVAFLSSVFTCFTLFIKAGNKLRNAV